MTPRISLEIDAPWLFASRKSANSPIKYASSGVGDTIVGAMFGFAIRARSPK